MTRKHEDSDAGREARRLVNGLWNRGFIVYSGDNQRGANEGLGEREIRALAEENSRPFGLSRAAQVIAERARQAGHDPGANA